MLVRDWLRISTARRHRSERSHFLTASLSLSALLLSDSSLKIELHFAAARSGSPLRLKCSPVESQQSRFERRWSNRKARRNQPDPEIKSSPRILYLRFAFARAQRRSQRQQTNQRQRAHRKVGSAEARQPRARRESLPALH